MIIEHEHVYAEGQERHFMQSRRVERSCMICGAVQTGRATYPAVEFHGRQMFDLSNPDVEWDAPEG